ncbi:MAG: MaoC/PaaZ C-terminal domain-containing protein, partial [Desulfomonilaceae bacterium]
GIIASGWHTVSLAMRLLVDNYVSPVASLGSPGADELRWFEPVRPGDTISLRVTILEAKTSRSKPDRGTVRTYVEVMNQHRQIVMTWKGIGLMKKRGRG